MVSGQPTTGLVNSSESDSLLTLQEDSESTYPPRLASTIASREYAFEADSDTLSNPGEHQDQYGTSEADTTPLARNSFHSGPPRLSRGDSLISRGSDQDDEEPLLSSDPSKPSPFSPESPSDHSHLLDSGGGLFAGVANMANSILGAGIIGLPYALKNSGFFTGTAMIIILGIITDWSIRLIALNSKLTGQRNYIGILEHCFGFPGKAAVSFFQFTFAFGGMCAFGVIVGEWKFRWPFSFMTLATFRSIFRIVFRPSPTIFGITDFVSAFSQKNTSGITLVVENHIGDTIPHVLTALLPFLARIDWLAFLFSRSFVIVFFTITVSYPLSLYRDIAKLSKASTLALISMVIIVISVATKGPSVDPSLRGDPNKRWSIIEPGLTEAIGVISFAFVCHHNSLLIYGSLKTPTLDRFAQVIHVSTALSVIACLIMSFSGFLTFTQLTQANILNNFPNDDIVINIARVCFGLNMFTTLPLECFVCRETIETFFYHNKPFDQTRHVIYTTLLVGSGLLISLSTCDLGIVLELTGGFAASALAFVFPAACHLKLSTKSIYSSQNFGALCLVIFGLAVMVISTVGSLFKALDPSKPAKVCN